MALMEDERLILRWLSQYGPLRWPQIRGLLYYRPQRSVNRLVQNMKHVYRLLTFLSYVGEYPLCSLQLFGSKEVWRKLIHKHSQRQEYRIPGHADKIICRLLLITGKGKSKSVRLSKGGQNILEIVNPNAALYYTQNYLRHNHAGEAKRLDRFHRVAESAALINLAGFETCPYRLPQLQMVTIRKVVTDAPSFYISKVISAISYPVPKRIADCTSSTSAFMRAISVRWSLTFASPLPFQFIR